MKIINLMPHDLTIQLSDGSRIAYAPSTIAEGARVTSRPGPLHEMEAVLPDGSIVT